MSKVKKCVGKEGYQRMNYLLQISNLYVRDDPKTDNLSNYYSNLMMSVSKKTVQRIEPNIKRIICKRCKSMLIAGITCTVRIKRKCARWKCILCGIAKVFKIDGEYKFWLEQPESVAETLDYDKNKT